MDGLSTQCGMSNSGGGGGSFVPEYRASYYDGTDALATYTFSACDLGAADADREIVAIVSSRDFGGATFSSVTIGGVTATADTVRLAGENSADIQVFRAIVPTGTTGDIVVNTSGGGSIQGVRIAVYRMIGPISIEDSATISGTTVEPTLTISVVAGGVIAGSCLRPQSSQALTYTSGADDDATGDDGYHQVTVASREITATDASYDVVCDQGTNGHKPAAFAINYKQT